MSTCAYVAFMNFGTASTAIMEYEPSTIGPNVKLEFIYLFFCIIFDYMKTEKILKRKK